MDDLASILVLFSGLSHSLVFDHLWMILNKYKIIHFTKSTFFGPNWYYITICHLRLENWFTIELCVNKSWMKTLTVIFQSIYS